MFLIIIKILCLGLSITCLTSIVSKLISLRIIVKNKVKLFEDPKNYNTLTISGGIMYLFGFSTAIFIILQWII